MPTHQRITPCLWFDDQAEEAANYYVSIFKNSRILDIGRYGEAGQEIHGRPPGSVMVVEFELDGQRFTALNGGPIFQFNEAVSLQVSCETQEEVDDYWEKLTQGGDEKGPAVRLAQGQIRPFLAGGPHHRVRAPQGPHVREIPESHDGHAADEEARRRGDDAGLRGIDPPGAV